MDPSNQIVSTEISNDTSSKVFVVKKGILSKKSRSKFYSGPWVLRTVVLDSDNRLLYYDGKVLKGEVMLAGTAIDHTPLENSENTFAFQITNIMSVKRTQTTTLTLAAGSFKEADDWVSKLSKASVGLTSTGAAGYISFEEVAASTTKQMDMKELKEKRFRQRSEKEKNNSKDNLLKCGDLDSSDDDSD